MNIKKIISVALASAISFSMLAVTANANYNVSAEDGTITWDFAEYTTKTGATGDTTYAMDPIDYNGLKIYLANGNDKDYIYTDGVHLGGKYGENTSDSDSATGKSAGRYIAYTAPADGTLYVTGTNSGNNKRWGIIADLTTSPNFSADHSTKSSGSQTVSMPLVSGTTYYIYGKDAGVTVTKVQFKPDEYVAYEKLSSVEGTDGSVADVFYCTEHLEDETAVTAIDVTVNEVTKTLNTTVLSGSGSVCFGVVVGYNDGESKGYVPSFVLR